MYDCRSQASVSGERSTVVAIEETGVTHESSRPGRHDTHEGDVIQGLRSGLICSLAIWAMLLAIGALLFT